MMKKWLLCLLLFLPARAQTQPHDTVLDSLKRPLPKGATVRQEAERLQAILRNIFFSNEYDFGDFPVQLDSLDKCCIAGKTGDGHFEKVVKADITFYKAAALLYVQPSVAKPEIQTALRQYSMLGDSPKQAMAYMGSCMAASAEGDSLEFAAAYDKALQFAPSIREPYELGNLYNTLGVSCYDFGRYAEAIQHSYRILELIDKNPTPEMLEGRASIYYNIGGVYIRLGDYANARQYNEKAVKEAAATKLDPAEYLIGLAGVLALEKNYKRALEVYQIGLSNHPVPNNLNLIAASTYGMATCYRHLGDLEKALSLARKGIELLPIQKHASYGSAALQELANCEFELGMADSSLTHALLAFQTFSSANNNLGSVEAAELLIKIYRQKNDFRKALEYSELRYKYQQQIERQQSTRQLAFGEFTRDNDVKTARREAEIQAQLTQQRNIRYALLAGLAVLALLAFLLYNRYRFKQKTAEQLQAKNREVEAARARAEASEAFKSRFLANMSHEIRTPLHGIAGFTGLLLDTALSEKQRRWLSSIHHSTDRLGEVVNDILDLSKLEAGEVKLRQTACSPARVAADVCDALALRAENKGVELNLDIADGIPPAVLCDPTRLYQILMNLAGNAVKFTEEGSVRLAISPLPAPEAGHCALLFSIRDSGIGIPADKLSAIFDNFRQASDDTTARFGGTGLGLSIARELVQLHGSDIQVESTVGKGSIFSFALALPLADPAGLEADTAKGGDLHFSQPLRFLLADDNALNREIATGALLRHFENARITEAVNGKEALDQVRRQEFDLILMDLQMPEMNGMEATRLIREGSSAHLPVIALTASATPGEIEAALAYGMDRHLAKPFKPRELARVIAEVLGLEAGAVAAPALQASGDEKTTSGPFDLTFLRDFCAGDEAQVRHFLQKFQEQCPLEIEKLASALRDKNREAVYRAAHSFRPQLEFVGLRAVGGLVLRLEQGAISSLSFEELAMLLEQVKATLPRHPGATRIV